MKYRQLDFDKVNRLLPDSTILAGFRGSHSHGTSREGFSDIDILSVHTAPLEHYLGFRRRNQETISRFEGDYDIVSHELRKFCDMLLGANPNVVSLLWLPAEMYDAPNNLGFYLRLNRDLFISKKFFYSFRGYAQQMKNNLHKEVYEGYAAENRREERERLGYDPKAAAEMVRIYSQGIEFLNTGRMTFPRPEAQLLLNIKSGRIDPDHILKYGDYLEQQLEQAHENSDLPEKPNRDSAEKVMMRIITEYYNMELSDAQ